MTKPITIDEVVSFPYAGVGECDLSSDGKRVAYTITHQRNIYIFDLEKWSLLESFEGRSAKWSPADSDVLIFVKRNTPGVFFRHIDGAERQLGENVGEVRKVGEWSLDTTFEWSQDGRFLALVVPLDSGGQEVDNNGDEGDIVVVRPPSPTYACALFVLDVETNKITFQSESDVGESYVHLAWRPSGNHLTIVSVKENQSKSDRDWRLFDIDLRTGKRKSRIGPGKNEISMPKWSPDGRQLALGYSPYNYLHPVRHLCAVMDADSTRAQILDRDYFVDAIHWGGNGRKIYFSGLKGISSHVVCVDTISGKRKVVVERTGLTHLKGVSQDERRLLTVYRGLKSLLDVHVIALNSGQSKAVTQCSNQLSDYELSNAEVVEWQSYDGFALQGVIVPPLGKSMSPEHPTIVDLHCGPTEGGAAIFFRYWHWLAAEGFQVFAPDFRGSQQYQWVEPPTQEMDYKDAMSGIEWLASQRMCDKTRMGVYGFSYGAILGAYSIGKTTLFRAAVLLNGSYDWRIVGHSLNRPWHSSSTLEMQGTPWEIPHVYHELSPTSHIAKVETPVLLCHSENDGPAHAEIYTGYLRGAGKKVEYVLYKGAGHTLRKESHKKDHWERTLNWFRKYLCIGC